MVKMEGEGVRDAQEEKIVRESRKDNAKDLCEDAICTTDVQDAISTVCGLCRRLRAGQPAGVCMDQTTEICLADDN
jgi:hypothetical protein